MTSKASSGRVVLVVDDEPFIRAYAIDVLEEAGFVTLDACDAEEALHCLSEHPEVSVLFTDINMPGKEDGLALAHRIHDRRPDIKLILTSGREKPNQDEIPDNGLFLAKPYQGHVLARMIKTAA
jgi:CheY-like chemotaxis protein